MGRVDRSRLPQSEAVPVPRFPVVRDGRLSNGLALKIAEHPGPPVVTFRLMMPVGSASDPPGSPGLAALTADLLDEGNADRTGLEVHAALDAIGARLGTEVSADATVISLTTLSRYASEGLALLADIVARPRFDDADVDRVRALRRSRLRQMRSAPSAVADRVFIETVYPEHPYGHLGVGTDESLAGFTRADVFGFHQDAYQLGIATLIASGALTHDQFVASAEGSFGKLTVRQPTKGAVAEPMCFNDVRALATNVVLVDRPGAVQSELRVGHVAAARQTPDYHALRVLNMVLGGQFVSRLNQVLREEKGYTYGVHTVFDCRRAPGPFTFQGSVQADATVESIREVLGQMVSIGGDRPVVPAELDLAQAALTRGFARGFETAGQVVRGIGQLVLHELPEDSYDRFVPEVEAVDIGGVTAAAKAHLHADRATIVVVGPAEVVGPGLDALGLGEVILVDALTDGE